MQCVPISVVSTSRDMVTFYMIVQNDIMQMEMKYFYHLSNFSRIGDTKGYSDT